MKRVVVTGIGAVTPLGNTFAESWEALKAGLSGIKPITKFDASGLTWTIAGELKGFDPGRYLSSKDINRLDPFVQYAVASASMAIEDAFIPSMANRHSLPDTAGVIIGSSRGGISTIEKTLIRGRQSVVGSQESRVKTGRVSPYLMPSTTISMAASYVAQKLAIKGHCLGISNACASGTNAIGEAFRLIKSGYAQMILAGGAEAPICRLCIEGYGTAGALSKQAQSPRPFDIKRDGFVLSEGACIIVLEDYEHALKRGAHIYAEVAGYGNTTDAFHITRPYAEGEARAMQSALDEAGIRQDEVDYINSHGTGTTIGDIAEAEAIRVVFKERSSLIPASAVKSMTGHMLAGSGAFELASTLMSMKECVIPPTIHLNEQAKSCGLKIFTQKTSADIRTAITNSFGFGGVNAVIAIKSLKNS